MGTFPRQNFLLCLIVHFHFHQCKLPIFLHHRHRILLFQKMFAGMAALLPRILKTVSHCAPLMVIPMMATSVFYHVPTMAAKILCFVLICVPAAWVTQSIVESHVAQRNLLPYQRSRQGFHLLQDHNNLQHSPRSIL